VGGGPCVEPVTEVAVGRVEVGAEEVVFPALAVVEVGAVDCKYLEVTGRIPEERTTAARRAMTKIFIILLPI